MGRFFVESKSFEFIIDSGGNSLYVRIIERGKGYICSICLGGGIFWLLSRVDEVAWLENSVGFVRKVRDSQSALLCQRCYNSHRNYLAIEEFSGSGWRGVILLPEGKKKWGWCGFVKVMHFLLSPFTSVNCAPSTIVPPSPVFLFALVE